jgi:GAF domain-containing protein
VAAAISCFTNGDGSRWAHSWSETWAKALPFAFSFFIVAAASLERNINRKAALIRASRDELVTGLIRFIHDSPNVSETVIALQARVAMFLKARRSTLYLLDSNESGQAVFKATYIHGDEKTRGKVSRVVRPDAGIIGYVCENRSPLLIEDIRQDPRFAAMIANSNEKDSDSLYQTGSCMIIPLIYGNALLGVLTFADKKDGSVFNQDDFAIAVEVSTDLAVLLDSRQLQESLKA